METAELLRPRLSSSQRAAIAFRDRFREELQQLTTGRPDRDLTEEVARHYHTNRAYLFKMKFIQAKRPELVERICAGELSIAAAEVIARGTIRLPRSQLLVRLKKASASIKQARNTLRGTAGYADLAPHFGALMESLRSQMRRCIGKRQRGSARRRSDA